MFFDLADQLHLLVHLFLFVLLRYLLQTGMRRIESLILLNVFNHLHRGLNAFLGSGLRTQINRLVLSLI
jgi:hypothetical protein